MLIVRRCLIVFMFLVRPFLGARSREQECRHVVVTGNGCYLKSEGFCWRLLQVLLETTAG